MSSVWLNAPLTGDQEQPSFSADVGWQLGKGAGPVVVAGEQLRLTASVGTVSPATYPVPGAAGSTNFSVVIAAPVPAQVVLTPELVDSGGHVIASGAPQTIPLSAGTGMGGVIIVSPPPPPLPGPAPIPALAAAVGGPAAAAAVCPPPVVLNASFRTDLTRPTVGIVVEIYHVVDGQKSIDFVAIPDLHGGVLVSDPDGSIHVNTTFTSVFPAVARTQHRFYRFYVLGVLGSFTPVAGGVVT